MLTYANGGPRPAMGNLESVDYKGIRALKSCYSEFHHITGAVFFLFNHDLFLFEKKFDFVVSQFHTFTKKHIFYLFYSFGLILLHRQKEVDSYTGDNKKEYT